MSDQYNIPQEVIDIVKGMAEKGLELSGIPVDKLIEDRFYWPKFRDHLAIIERYTGNLDGKSILDIGCGVGSFLLYVAKNRSITHGYGIEKSDSEHAYGRAHEAGMMLMAANGVHNIDIVEGIGESLPYPDASIDLIYSTNVLEHVQDPEKVMDEAWRVLAPDGYMQIVVPNYASWWEGHYGTLWIPYLTKKTGSIYLRLMGKDPAYLMDLQLIKPSFFFRWQREKSDVRLLTMGEDVFSERLDSFNPTYSKLSRLNTILKLCRKLKLQRSASALLNALSMYTPIIYTIQKRSVL